MIITISPWLLRTGVGCLLYMAVGLVDRLIILVTARRFPRMGAADSRSLRSERCARMKEFVRRSKYVPFRRSLWDVRREFMRRLFLVLHGTLGSYLRDALHEGGADVVACIRASRP
jgi:hypothetical protein